MSENENVLERVAREENLVLFDSCLNKTGGSNGYMHNVYPSRRFEDLDEGILLEYIIGLKNFIGFIEKENTFTVNGVVRETEKFLDLFSDKTKNLNSRIFSRRHSGRNEEEDIQYPTQKYLMDEICALANESWRLSKRSELTIEDPKLYNFIFNGVDSFTQSSIKSFESRYFSTPLKHRNPSEFKSDQHLVASSMYLSFKGEDNVILTRDSDIFRLAKNFLKGVYDGKMRGFNTTDFVAHPSRVLFIDANLDVNQCFRSDYFDIDIMETQPKL